MQIYENLLAVVIWFFEIPIPRSQEVFTGEGLGILMKDCPYSLAQKAPEGIIVKCFHSKL